MPVFRDNAVQRVFWDTPTLQQAERALNLTSLRQRVLTHNLANVNTPGYQRRDVSFEDHLARHTESLARHTEPSLPMKTTDPRHITSKPSIEPPTRIVVQNPPMRIDGNSVDPDREMAALAENELRYIVLTRIASGQIRGLMTAITGGRP